MNPSDGGPKNPPEEIALPGFLLRRWSEDDAPSLLVAITESIEHLRPWFHWAARTPGLSDRQEYVASAGQRWDAGEAFEYGVFDRATMTILGGFGLHDRVGPGGWDIEYWVHTDYTRRGIATAGAAVLTEAAFSLHGTDRVEIHCDQVNRASAAVPRRLGYRFGRIQDHEPDSPAESGKRMIWIMTREVFGGSEAERRARDLLSAD
jgi:RimJ/RimL family protein N-acetyltransferase